MTGVMLDEMISPSIVARLWEDGVDAICARDRGLLSVSDTRVWQYAQTEQRTLVTGNLAHFERLARKSPTHYGVIAMPEGGTRDAQFSRVMAGIKWGDSLGYPSPFTDVFAYVQENGAVIGRILTARNDNYLTVPERAAAIVKPFN